MRITSLLLLMMVTACGNDYGHSVSGDNFVVYFTDDRDGKMAEEIAFFWKNNDLLTGKDQALQLIRSDESHVLKLIANNPEDSSALNFEEHKLLLQLRDSLRSSVCDNCDLVLEICDNKFATKYRIE